MQKLSIDIVSDVVCPWCAIGYAHLTRALDELKDRLEVEVHWRAFELNPHMGAEGQEINEHLMEKYGSSEEQLQANKARLVELGKAAGVDFNFAERSRIYNTLDCHKLLHWAGEHSAAMQTQLKQALFHAYFTQGLDISNRQVLLEVVKATGLDSGAAEVALDDEQLTQAVREEQHQYQSLGISAVPAFIINKQYLISGGQPVEVFKQALLETAQRDARST